MRGGSFVWVHFLVGCAPCCTQWYGWLAKNTTNWQKTHRPHCTFIDARISVMCHSEGASKRQFLAMMSSDNGTIKNWPQSLREYPTAFKAGNRSDPDSLNFIRQWIENTVKNTKKQWAVKWKHCSRPSHGILCKGAKFPGAPMFYHWLGYTSWSATQMVTQGSSSLIVLWGDKQIEGIDYTDKYALVVSWTTVQMLMILTFINK